MLGASVTAQATHSSPRDRLQPAGYTPAVCMREAYCLPTARQNFDRAFGSWSVARCELHQHRTHEKRVEGTSEAAVKSVKGGGNEGGRIRYRPTPLRYCAIEAQYSTVAKLAH